MFYTRGRGIVEASQIKVKHLFPPPFPSLSTTSRASREEGESIREVVVVDENAVYKGDKGCVEKPRSMKNLSQADHLLKVKCSSYTPQETERQLVRAFRVAFREDVPHPFVL